MANKELPPTMLTPSSMLLAVQQIYSSSTSVTETGRQKTTAMSRNLETSIRRYYMPQIFVWQLSQASHFALLSWHGQCLQSVLHLQVMEVVQEMAIGWQLGHLCHCWAVGKNSTSPVIAGMFTVGLSGDLPEQTPRGPPRTAHRLCGLHVTAFLTCMIVCV